MNKIVDQTNEDLANIPGSVVVSGLKWLDAMNAEYIETTAYGLHVNIYPTLNYKKITYLNEFRITLLSSQ